MPTPEPLTPSDQELLGQVCGFAVRRAENGVYFNLMHSKSLGQPVALIVAVGDQALAVQQLIMKARVDESPIEVVSDLSKAGLQW